MALTEKGQLALKYINLYFDNTSFSAKDLSDKCGEKIVAATLNSVASNGYLEKLGGSPVLYRPVADFADLIQNLEVETKKGCDNSNLCTAKQVKNNEFYTRYEDIEAEVMKYRKQFKDKVVYLPCDDPAEKKSEFWSFFVNNFDAFGLKKLIATHYDENGRAYKIWIDGDTSDDGFVDDSDAIQEDLQGNGDFQSPECIDIMNECDIVCTNPPFSLFRDFMDTIMKTGKKFLIIGNQNAFTYKEIFKLIKENKIWTGYNMVKQFRQPDGSIKKFGNVCWFTNMITSKRNEEFIFTKEYNSVDYPKYDNYDCIEVSKVVNIPKDYSGIMGVPITFLDKYNPNQFEILGLDDHRVDWLGHGPKLNGKTKYRRVIVKRK